ncbi:hypothetical protein EBN03_10815 [Nocardia stercoris]|uniref:Uncharacterized protein n=1 Tax=Nocardia stercoris TaxID=2483361 RepID=A0A3M2L941_9NOCA|nr:hypothetical protein EBN03_10815 [Nocardia stercoris]
MYPADIDDAPGRLGHEVAFCINCECGTVVLAVAWGDKTRVMATGGLGLYAAFENSGWPELDFGDPRVESPFLARMINTPDGWLEFQRGYTAGEF